MTEDPIIRLKQHNEYSLPFWTKRATNWKLIHSEEFETKANAIIQGRKLFLASHS